MFTVLCVDNDERYLTLLEQLFSDQGQFYIFGKTQDGSEAITYAIRLKPDIVLMDLATSRLGEFSAATCIKSLLPQTKVMMTTAQSQIEGQAAALENGTDGLVSKSHFATDLFPLLRSLVAHNGEIEPNSEIHEP